MDASLRAAPVRVELVKVKDLHCSAGVATVSLVVDIVTTQPLPLYDVALAIWQDDFLTHGACHQHFADRVRRLDSDAAAPFGALRWSPFSDLDSDGCGDLPGGAAVRRHVMKKVKAFCNAEGNLLPLHVCPHWNTDPASFCARFLKAENAEHHVGAARHPTILTCDGHVIEIIL